MTRNIAFNSTLAMLALLAVAADIARSNNQPSKLRKITSVERRASEVQAHCIDEDISYDDLIDELNDLEVAVDKVIKYM